MPRSVLGILLCIGTVCAPQAHPEETVFDLDASRTEVNFTLAAMLHSVHGAFHLRSGTIRYDPSTGKASGEVIVDVASGATGNPARDRKMHADVFESSRFPEAVLTPMSIEGRYSPAGTSDLQVVGILRIHGAAHEMKLSAHVEFEGDRWTAVLHGEVPYVEWGLANPSTFFLRVSDRVQLEIRATGRRSAAAR
jgi:polyisoprenoid-binding protein YceI